MASPATSSDGWDWPYIVYVGRVWLCYTEEELWKLTPRQFKAQLDTHEEVMQATYGTANKDNGRKLSRQPMSYIDQIPGW